MAGRFAGPGWSDAQSLDIPTHLRGPIVVRATAHAPALRQLSEVGEASRVTMNLLATGYATLYAAAPSCCQLGCTTTTLPSLAGACGFELDRCACSGHRTARGRG